MNLGQRRSALDALLVATRDLWHPQPFRERRPVWVDDCPGLAAAAAALTDDEVAALEDDGSAALAWVARHRPEVSEIGGLVDLPARTGRRLCARGPHWAWEIPGRKRGQIEAFAAAAGPAGVPVVDWCGGKGHLGRLLALDWKVPVTTLEVDASLCEAGGALARRAGADQEFRVADALTVAGMPAAGQQAVALHACGHLHRRLVGLAAAQQLQRLDVAPCCYHLGMADRYLPLAPGASLALMRDDARLAVTETVTAGQRQRRQSAREMAWKLAFVAWRDSVVGSGYRSFKPVSPAWMRGDFSAFIAAICAREGLPVPGAADALRYESAGWQRREEIVRQSVVRHAFRRALEVWLALDLAACLAGRGYAVRLGTFCPRNLTPRNLLLSAQAG